MTKKAKEKKAKEGHYGKHREEVLYVIWIMEKRAKSVLPDI